MTFKKNINDSSRTFYVSITGNDDEDGLSLETAVATLGEAITRVNALIPPSSTTDPSAIIASGAGTFTENITVPTGCQFDGRNILNFPSTGDANIPGDQASFEILGSIVTGVSASVFRINNRSEIGIDAKSVIVFGTSGIGVFVDGTSDDIFVDISQLSLRGDSSIGVQDETADGAPEIYQIDQLTLEADNTTGFIYNPTVGTSECVFIAGFIGDVGTQTGTTGIEILAGTGEINILEIDASTAIHIASGATCNLISNEVTGTILIDAGGTLNCHVITHIGTLTNNGDINGQIGSEFFGDLNIESTINLSIAAANGTAEINFLDESDVIQGVLSYDDSTTDINLTATNGNINLAPPGGAVTVSTDLELTLSGSQSYVFTDAVETLSLRSQGAGQNALLGLQSFDFDGTDDVCFESFGFGLSGAADAEILRMGYLSASNTFEINSLAFGTGTLRPLVMSAGVGTNQIIAAVDGTVSINTNSTFAADGELLTMAASANQEVGFRFDDELGAEQVSLLYRDSFLDVQLISNQTFRFTGADDLTFTSTNDLILNSSASDIAFNVQTTVDNTGLILDIEATTNDITHYTMSNDSGVVQSDFSYNDSTGATAIDTQGTLILDAVTGLIDITADAGAVQLTASTTVSLNAGSGNINLNGNMRVSNDGQTLFTAADELALTGATDVLITATLDDVIITAADELALIATDGPVDIDSGGGITIDSVINTNITAGAILNLTSTANDVNIISGDDICLLPTNQVGINTTSPDVLLDIESDDADTQAIVRVTSTGTNGGITRMFVGDRDPDGNVTGQGGNEYYRDDGAESGSYENLESGSGTNWLKRSLNSSAVIEIHNATQFEALASGGTITISSDITLILKNNADITTTSVFDITSAGELSILGIDAPNGSTIIYSGTGTFITAAGDININNRARLTSSSTGTLFAISGGARLNLVVSTITGWDDLGTITDGNATVDRSGLVSYSAPLVFIDSGLISNGPVPVLGDEVFEFQHVPGASPINVNITGLDALLMTGAPIRVDPLIEPDSVIQLTNSNTGSSGIALFDTAGSTGTFTAVSDTSIGGAITSVTDNGGIAVFNHAQPDLVVDELVVITGFITNTDYNGTFFVTAAGVGTFEVGVAFGSNETGTFDSTKVTITSTAHGLSSGQTLTLDTDFSTDYDGGFIIFDVVANSFDVAATFVATETGTWNTGGLDETDIHVLSFASLQGDNSRTIGSVFSVGNTATTTASSGGTDLVFSGAGLVAEATNNERWKLIDAATGEIEITSKQGVSGSYQAIVSGTPAGSETFSFEVLKNGVSLPEALLFRLSTGGSGSTSIPILAPVTGVEGDTFIIEISEPGSSDIDITDLVVSVQ